MTRQLQTTNTPRHDCTRFTASPRLMAISREYSVEPVETYSGILSIPSPKIEGDNACHIGLNVGFEGVICDVRLKIT